MRQLVLIYFINYFLPSYKSQQFVDPLHVYAALYCKNGNITPLKKNEGRYLSLLQGRLHGYPPVSFSLKQVTWSTKINFMKLNLIPIPESIL